jgi:hypothetical protein
MGKNLDDISYALSSLLTSGGFNERLCSIAKFASNKAENHVRLSLKKIPLDNACKSYMIRRFWCVTQLSC